MKPWGRRTGGRGSHPTRARPPPAAARSLPGAGVAAPHRLRPRAGEVRGGRARRGHWARASRGSGRAPRSGLRRLHLRPAPAPLSAWLQCAAPATSRRGRTEAENPGRLTDT